MCFFLSFILVSSRVAKAGFGYCLSGSDIKKVGFSLPGFQVFGTKLTKIRVGVRVPFFGFGSGSDITKSGFSPWVSGFRVPDYINT